VFGGGKTVIRGGYARIFGRLNGVDLVLVPLLGPGILQGVTCVNPENNGTCAGTGVATPANAFRFGPDGLVAPLAAASSTIAQPFIPGLGSNPESVDANTLDPSFKPDRTDQFTLTIQREINPHMHLEVGYIGKIIRNEMLEENLDAVPYMETLNGQPFSAAYAQVFEQMFFNGQSAANVTAQPFFEAALGGAGSSYCAGYSSCTAALASKNTALFKETAVSDIWTAMTKAPSWTLGRTIFSQPIPGNTVGQATSIDATTSAGFGNYNALFVRLQTTNWHGLTAVQNFTWGRAWAPDSKCKLPVPRRRFRSTTPATNTACKVTTTSSSTTCPCSTRRISTRAKKASWDIFLAVGPSLLCSRRRAAAQER
jgi:hypothetical protein